MAHANGPFFGMTTQSKIYKAINPPILWTMVHACEIDIPELLGASKWIVYNVKDVGGQNSSPQFISRVGTASSDFGVVGGKMGK